MCAQADLVFHIAGVNRPLDPNEFHSSNVSLTSSICENFISSGKSAPIIFTSSSQVSLENPDGQSKFAAEQIISNYSIKTGSHTSIYRLKGVFGKWCRPNYNSVVATFCYNIARDLPITISDSQKEIELIYIDDVIDALISELKPSQIVGVVYRDVEPVYTVTLGTLAKTIMSFRDSRQNLLLPSFENHFVRKLYATYLSYLEPMNFSYNLTKRIDARGCLAEVLKSQSFGQIFISRTAPGVTRGNHYHNSKTEKFLVVEGQASVQFRSVYDREVIEYLVNGEEMKIVDIPPGYTHSIQNIGSSELVTLFWASELFDPTKPDTYLLDVVPHN
jgi:UDP-2-acetamido-2,6-beta-L-arabino-hexul-4-ose reductase